MEKITIKGIDYYSAQDVADLWGLNKKTVERYAAPSSKKIQGCLRIDGVLFVPANTIRPITKSIAQGIVWGILLIKNDPDAFLDLTKFGIANAQLGSVLDELERQMYIDPVDGYKDERDRLLKLRLTDKAINLVQYKKKFAGNSFKGKLNSSALSTIFAGVQTLLQLSSNIG